ncbi:MAG: prephenate dehydrogenase [Deltaproteobacteria bacterium]
MTFSKITIVGLGLIGGSLASALKEAKAAEEVWGVDLNPKALEYALSAGVVDRASSKIDRASVGGAEIIVAATHVGAIPQIARAVVSEASAGAVITDVGSVKSGIVAEIAKFIPPHLRFVGGHPIAGTERSGVWAANPKLFCDRRCILTPDRQTHSGALDKVSALWEAVGARVLIMDAESHDRIFAFVSHLPHVVAYALVNSIAAQEKPDNMLDFGGGGLRDYTRIAASSPEMWSDIFTANKRRVLESIAEFRKSLERIERCLSEDDLAGLIAELSSAAASGSGNG